MAPIRSSTYSKLEKVPDGVVDAYLTLLTDLELTAQLDNPREQQKMMALEITRARHGDAAASSLMARS